MLKILFFSQIPPTIGGIEIYLRNLTDQLKQKGLLPYIIVEKEKSGFYEYITLVNQKKRCKLQKLSLMQIIKQVKNTHIVHIQAFGYPSSFLIFLLAKIFRKPIITTLHGGVQSTSVHDFPITEKLKYYIYNLIRLSIGKIVIDNSQAVISVSKHDLQLIRKNIFCTRKRNNFWIPNAINLKSVQKSAKNLERKYITFIGRLSLLKGFDIFINMAKKLYADNPNLHFLVIGDGNLGSLISQNPQLKIVHYSQVSPEEIANYYLQSKILLICSLMEGLPTTILEAMKYNVAIVSTDVGGIPEIIIDGTNGLLFNLKSVESGIGKMKSLLSDENLHVNLVSNGQHTIQKKFSWDIVTKEIIAVYQRVLGIRKN